MWVVSIYLIEPAAQHKELAYFSADKHELGEIVRLPARARDSWGLVVACDPLKDARQSVRGAEFLLKKITAPGKRLLSNAFLHAAFEAAAHSAISVGAMLNALMPATVLEKMDMLPEIPATAAKKTQKRPHLVVASRTQRIEKYRALIEKALARGTSALIIVPTIAEAERLASAIPKSILLHSALTKKNLINAWSEIARTRKPAVVVGTPIALSAPLKDIGVLIMERPLARGYERNARPFISIRVMAEALAKSSGAEFVLGSAFAPIEDSSLAKSSPLAQSNTQIIDMRPPAAPENALPSVKPKFELFSALARERIALALAEGKNIALLCARKGLSPHTTCDDCGTPLSCPRCGSGLVLHEERQPQSFSLIEASMRRWFECHYCGFVEKVTILCPVCGSWRLSMHGIALTLVAREAEKLFPQAKHFVLDDDTLERFSATQKLMASYERARGAILSATEGGLPYLNNTVPLVVVVSADSMLYVSEYSAPEHALGFLCELQGMSEELLLQTRVPEHPALLAFAASDYQGYYERELELRQKFRYPPYFALIRLTISGAPARVKEQTEAIAKALERFAPQRFPGRSKRKSLSREHILIRLPKENWVDPKLLVFLRNLPPSVEIRVNPRTIISD